MHNSPVGAELCLPDHAADMPCTQAMGSDRKHKEKKAPISLTLVSFAVTRKAYQRITERFAKEYEEATGQPVKFRLSFGGSGTQVPFPIDTVAVLQRKETVAVVFPPRLCDSWRRVQTIQAVDTAIAAGLHNVAPGLASFP